MYAVLAIADTRSRCTALESILGNAGEQLLTVTGRTGVEPGLAAVRHHSFDLIALSLHGPPSDTLRAIRALRRRAPTTPIIAEVPGELPLVALQALALGASDCLKHPVAPWEWQSRCRSVLGLEHQRRLLLAALRQAAYRVRQGCAEPDGGNDQLLDVLHNATALHDVVTGEHERRTGRLAAVVADGLGLPEAQCRLLGEAASLHDIGKLGIRDEVLRKPGRFTAEERAEMNHHPRIGFEILSQGTTPALRLGAEAALSHHERIDGSGYPDGLAGEAIPLGARISAVADVFDALAAGRPYHNPRPPDAAFEYLRANAGTHFDPACVEALVGRRQQAEAIVRGG